MSSAILEGDAIGEVGLERLKESSRSRMLGSANDTDAATRGCYITQHPYSRRYIENEKSETSQYPTPFDKTAYRSLQY